MSCLKCRDKGYVLRGISKTLGRTFQSVPTINLNHLRPDLPSAPTIMED